MGWKDTIVKKSESDTAAPVASAAPASGGWKSTIKKKADQPTAPGVSDTQPTATEKSEGMLESASKYVDNLSKAATNSAFEGLTLGAGNKVLGAMYAMYDVATDPMLKKEDFIERYNQYSDMTQDEFDRVSSKDMLTKTVSGVTEFGTGVVTGGKLFKEGVKALGKESVKGAMQVGGREAGKLAIRNNIAKKVLVGEGIGAATGAGYSDAETTGELVRDTAVGAGLGAAAERYAAPIMSGGAKLLGKGVEQVKRIPGFDSVVETVQGGVDKLGTILQRKTTGFGTSDTRNQAMKSGRKFGKEGEKYVDELADDAFTGKGLVDDAPLVGTIERQGTLHQKISDKVEETAQKLDEFTQSVDDTHNLELYGKDVNDVFQDVLPRSEKVAGRSITVGENTTRRVKDPTSGRLVEVGEDTTREVIDNSKGTIFEEYGESTTRRVPTGEGRVSEVGTRTVIPEGRVKDPFTGEWIEPYTPSKVKSGYEGSNTGSSVVTEPLFKDVTEQRSTVGFKPGTRTERVNGRTVISEPGYMDEVVPGKTVVFEPSAEQFEGLVSDMPAIKFFRTNLEPTVKQILGSNPTLTSIRHAKQHVGKLIEKVGAPESPHDMSEKLQLLNNLYDGLDELGRKALEKVNPELANKWKRLNRTQHVALKIKTALDTQVRKTENAMIPGIPLKKLLGHGAAAKFGGPLGVAASVLVDAYGPAAGARILKKLAHQLETGTFTGRASALLNDIYKTQGAEEAVKAYIRRLQTYGEESE